MILINHGHTTEMDPAAVSKSLRLNKRDGVFLGVALLLHGSLLLIPFTQFPSEQDLPQVLTISLLAPPQPQAVTESPRSPIAPPEAAVPEAASTAQSATPPPDESPPEAEPMAPEAPHDPVTTARLLDSASRLKWSFPKTLEKRQLGVHQAPKIPDNWRPGITLEDNLFYGMIVPDKIEVVDNWLASDGSYNKVINTPGGETLCGRQQAWDPMNPLQEHLTLFTKCGGGGKRSFKMPDRFLKHLVD
jgi:hypothetical protein